MTPDAVIEPTTQQDCGQCDGQAQQVVVKELMIPQALPEVTDKSDEAGGEKLSLQCGPKVLRGPAAEGSVDGERRAVHAVSAAEDAGEETAREQPGCAVVAQFGQVGSTEKINGEADDNCGEEEFGQLLVGIGQ